MVTLFFNYYSFCACILYVSANVLRENDLYRLDIVHYNDFHDRFEETSVAYPICTTNDTSCIGGFARLYHEIQALLEEKPNALVLNAGDIFQGTYWYSLLKWKISQEFINMIPNDAHALGNHEFDDGVAGLVPYLKALKAPVVAANLIVPEDSELYGLYKPYVIIERNGKKIGIIGLITTGTQMNFYFQYLSNSAGVTFSDPITVVEEQARLLTEQGVEIIVVLSHCGLDVDRKMAKQVGENIDVIVGGHTHSLLWNGEAPSKESVSGPYPVLVESDGKPSHKVLIVTASAFSKYLGNITVYFDQEGELDYFEGTPVFLNRSIPEDPRIKSLLQPYAEKLHEVVNQVIGYSTAELSSKPCGSGECAIGNLVTDAFWSAAHNTSKLPNVVLLETNNIRTSLSKGDITRGGVINVMPFTNKIVTFTIQGRYIIDALQRSVRDPWVAKPYAGPHTPMISGMKVKINTTSAEVLEALITTGDKNVAMDPDQHYQLTTLDFLAAIAFKNFKKYGRNLKVVGKDMVVIEEFIGKLSPITPYLDNRLTLVS